MRGDGTMLQCSLLYIGKFLYLACHGMGLSTEDGSFCVNTLYGEITDKGIVALPIYIPDDCDDKHYQNMI